MHGQRCLQRTREQIQDGHGDELRAPPGYFRFDERLYGKASTPVKSERRLFTNIATMTQQVAVTIFYCRDDQGEG